MNEDKSIVKCSVAHSADVENRICKCLCETQSMSTHHSVVSHNINQSFIQDSENSQAQPKAARSVCDYCDILLCAISETWCWWAIRHEMQDADNASQPPLACKLSLCEVHPSMMFTMIDKQTDDRLYSRFWRADRPWTGLLTQAIKKWHCIQELSYFSHLHLKIFATSHNRGCSAKRMLSLHGQVLPCCKLSFCPHWMGKTKTFKPGCSHGSKRVHHCCNQSISGTFASPKYL